MGKYKYWQIDSDEILDTHVITANSGAVKNNEDELPSVGIVKFTVRRYKDQNTHREQMEIAAEVDQNPSGTIVTNLIDMETDMPKLRAYGVVLTRPQYVELCHLLSEKYYFFKAISTGKVDNVVTPEIADEVLEMLCQYILDNDIHAITVKKAELYNIPLRAFNNELNDSKYKAYDLGEIKEGLFNRGYTVVNKGKFDYVVSVDGEKTKMVSLKKECVDPILDQLKAE